MSQQKVQVFAIGLPKAGTPEEKRRFYVRWRIDGRDKMRALKTKGEAERLCSRLQQALLSDQRFDPSDTDSRGWWRFRLADNREITVHVTTITAASDELDTTESA